MHPTDKCEGGLTRELVLISISSGEVLDGLLEPDKKLVFIAYLAHGEESADLVDDRRAVGPKEGRVLLNKHI